MSDPEIPDGEYVIFPAPPDGYGRGVLTVDHSKDGKPDAHWTYTFRCPAQLNVGWPAMLTEAQARHLLAMPKRDAAARPVPVSGERPDTASACDRLTAWLRATHDGSCRICGRGNDFVDQHADNCEAAPVIAAALRRADEDLPPVDASVEPHPFAHNKTLHIRLCGDCNGPEGAKSHG